MLDPDNHAGGTELRDARPATLEAEGYTGDTYCLGCDELLKRGAAIPKLTPSEPGDEPGEGPGGSEGSGGKGSGGTATSLQRAGDDPMVPRVLSLTALVALAVAVVATVRRRVRRG